MKDLTVIMYHYVRSIKGSRYPGLKGLETMQFKEQVSYLMKNYNPVSINQIINAYNKEEKLPTKAVLLTFDDAYIDHYEIVFPILYENGIQGCFYAPVRAVTEHTVLDVNKIHFILEKCHDDITSYRKIIKELELWLEEYRIEYNLQSFDYYYNRLAVPNRWDSKEVIFIKRLLQVELDETLRGILTDRLFSEYVLRDELSEETFSRELYMNVDQMRVMVNNGMHVGAHGFNHYWLGYQSKETQQAEIEKSLHFIDSIGGDVNNWTICYPYGNYNNDTIRILKANGCKLGFTCEVDLADTALNDSDAVYKIPRLDTNDIPKVGNSKVNDWWQKSI